jgi:hypothetical protein
LGTRIIATRCQRHARSEQLAAKLTSNIGARRARQMLHHAVGLDEIPSSKCQLPRHERTHPRISKLWGAWSCLVETGQSFVGVTEVTVHPGHLEHGLSTGHD